MERKYSKGMVVSLDLKYWGKSNDPALSVLIVGVSSSLEYVPYLAHPFVDTSLSNHKPSLNDITAFSIDERYRNKNLIIINQESYILKILKDKHTICDICRSL